MAPSRQAPTSGRCGPGAHVTTESPADPRRPPIRFVQRLQRLFRQLLPRDRAFVECFCRHSTLVARAADEFRAMMADGNPIVARCESIDRLEAEADVITRQTVRAIHRTYITPFDRTLILDLITALDDAIDLMKQSTYRMTRYNVGFTPEMRGMADCVVRATLRIRDAMPLLDEVSRNAATLTATSVTVRDIEGEADDLLNQGLQIVFSGDVSPGQKLMVERVYDLIDAVVDRCEDIVDVIDAIVLEQV